MQGNVSDVFVLQVQGHVKGSKARFDKLKLDCLQKVDLLAASRCNMFSHALIMYQNALIAFWERTAKTMSHVNESFKGYQAYEFSYIKELAEPKLDDDDDGKKDNKAGKKKQKDKGEEPKSKSEAKDEYVFAYINNNSRYLTLFCLSGTISSIPISQPSLAVRIRPILHLNLLPPPETSLPCWT